MTGISGKVVAITGASSGIGEATARLLAGRPGRGSASAGRPVCVDQAGRAASQFCHACVSFDGSRSSK
jgi:NADP-dependent 3-hydroxy acid dehydrogenase YdfG